MKEMAYEDTWRIKIHVASKFIIYSIIANLILVTINFLWIIFNKKKQIS